jgi:hypothetical protein
MKKAKEESDKMVYTTDEQTKVSKTKDIKRVIRS